MRTNTFGRIVSGWCVSAVVFATSLLAHGEAVSGRDIMAKSEEARKLKDITSSVTLTTGGGGGDVRVKTFTWWHKLGADGVHFRTLTRFTSPAEIRNEAVLIEERGKHDNEVLLYLPRFKKIRRVEGQSQSSSFMGSVFSYSDLATPHVDDYSQKWQRTEACPGDTKFQCHVVESLPSSDGVRDTTGYSKAIQWVRTDNYVPVRSELFDLKGAMWKTVVSSNIREIDPGAHKWMAHTVRADDNKTKKYTTIQFDQVKVNAGIPDATFSPQSLSKE